MAGAFRRVAVLDPRGAESTEDLRVRRARGSQPCPDIVVEAIGKARQRHAIDVLFVGVERHAVVRVGQLLDLRGEPKVARRLLAQRCVQRLPAQALPRELGGG